MKKTHRQLQQRGFALATVLIASTVMLTVLVAVVQSTVAIRVSLQSQFYGMLSKTAAESGLAYAKACLAANNGKPLWSGTLIVNDNCSGAVATTCLASANTSACTVAVSGNVVSSFAVTATVNASGYATALTSVGTVKLLRTSQLNTSTTPVQTYSAASTLVITAGNINITNMALNPSLEGDVTNTVVIGNTVGVVAQSSTFAWKGTKSMKLSGATGRKWLVNDTISTGDVITWSFYVYPTSGSIILTPYWERASPYVGGSAGANVTAPVNTWTRVTGQFTATSAQTGTGFGFGFLRSGTSTSDVEYLDAAIITRGATVYSYADGTSSGWVWNGTVNNSTSTGPGSGINATITNIDPNPSLETNTTTWAAVGSTTVSRDITVSQYGGASLKTAMPASCAANACGATVYGSIAVGTTLAVSTTYTVSAYVYVPSGTAVMGLTVSGTGDASDSNSSATSKSATGTNGSWVQLYNTFTTSATTATLISIKVVNTATTAASVTNAWVDGVMLTLGSTVYNYSDGGSTGWTWSGTANNSTSSGPYLSSAQTPGLINLDPNPSLETNTTTWSGPNSSTITRDTTQFYSGVDSLKSVMPASCGASLCGAVVYSSIAVGTTLLPNTTYTASVFVYVPTGTPVMKLNIQGSGDASDGDSNSTANSSANNTWVQLTNTFTTAASGTVSIVVINSTAIGASPLSVWMDGAMLTYGSSIYNFADGNTAGWTWTGGTTNNSISSGLPV